MTYRTEFGNYPIHDMPTLPEGFTDASWGNDVCPHFDHAALRISVWIDYPDKAQREYPDVKRFSVHSIDAEGDCGEMLFESDVWTLVLEFIQDTARDRMIAEYSDWNHAQGLDLGSADEHLFDESLTEAQRAWVRDFSERWEVMEHMLWDLNRN
jgi:hypothetical protein